MSPQYLIKHILTIIVQIQQYSFLWFLFICACNPWKYSELIPLLKHKERNCLRGLSPQSPHRYSFIYQTSMLFPLDPVLSATLLSSQTFNNISDLCPIRDIKSSINFNLVEALLGRTNI